jgi:hypothetical protein
MGYDNTRIYAEEWAEKLQEQLDEPNKFKDICRVEYTNVKVFHNPYLTDPTIQSLSRGTPYTMQPITETDESVTIDTSYVAASFIDRADLAQSTLLGQMELATRQGVLLNRKIEAALYADHASLTDFGTENLAGSAGSSQITVAVTNIDDIITNLARTISVASGDELLERNGGFIVWRPADFQILTSFMMANGFSTADTFLTNGVKGGVEYMGFTHYKSNSLSANHVIAGVKKLYHIGILTSTYGQIVVTQDPALTSGIGVTSRVDFKGKAWTRTAAVLFDVNVA